MLSLYLLVSHLSILRLQCKVRHVASGIRPSINTLHSLNSCFEGESRRTQLTLVSDKAFEPRD